MKNINKFNKNNKKIKEEAGFLGIDKEQRVSMLSDLMKNPINERLAQLDGMVKSIQKICKNDPEAKQRVDQRMNFLKDNKKDVFKMMLSDLKNAMRKPK